MKVKVFYFPINLWKFIKYLYQFENEMNKCHKEDVVEFKKKKNP